jgi:hypothetical protein
MPSERRTKYFASPAVTHLCVEVAQGSSSLLGLCTNRTSHLIFDFRFSNLCSVSITTVQVKSKPKEINFLYFILIGIVVDHQMHVII